MSKRGADDGGSGQPPIKKVHFEPHLIGSVSTLEEMDIKVLKFQHKKLAQRIEQRIRCESELRQRIEQLEKRQTQDDAVLNVVNRYWNQLNEDIRVLLQRFDAETADEAENKSINSHGIEFDFIIDSVGVSDENEVTTSFLTQLSTWDKEELDDKLANRVQVSKRAVAKVVQVIDRLMQRNEKFSMALRSPNEDGSLPLPDIDETLRQSQIEIMAENKNLQSLNTSLHEKYHTISLKMKELQDTVTGKETEAAELHNQIDDLQYELEKVRLRNDKLENHLAEAIEKLKSFHQLVGDQQPKAGAAAAAARPTVTTSVATQHLEDLQKEVEEYRELATNRLQELDKLHQTHREALKEVEKLKMDIRQLPESVIVETTEYKCLQSQFSVLYNESMQIKTMLDETRNQLHSSKNQHLRQIEMMESEELNVQKKMRNEMIQMEDVLAQIRKEYEMLRIEFEQNMAANEQTAPINREMRHLITSLQNHNGQLKGEVHRYKRKYKDAATENLKLRKEVEEINAKLGSESKKQEIKTEGGQQGVKEESAGDGLTNIKEEGIMKTELDGTDDENIKKEEGVSSAKSEKDGSSVGSLMDKKEGQSSACKIEKETLEAQRTKELKIAEAEVVRDLKSQLKKAMNDQKELKLLLDMYKGVSKDQREKVQLMATEKKLRSEIDDLRNQLKKMQ
ncbi:E3 ubiquitin-protein ligase Bre1, partial [Pseudolycoriella hygida]